MVQHSYNFSFSSKSECIKFYSTGPRAVVASNCKISMEILAFKIQKFHFAAKVHLKKKIWPSAKLSFDW